MTNWIKRMWRVASHEYLQYVRKRSFLFGAIGVPLLSIGVTALVAFIAVQSEFDTGRVGGVGFVDGANVLTETTLEGDDGLTFIAYPDEAAARAAVDAGAIGAYFVLPDDYIVSGRVRLVSQNDAPEGLKDQIDSLLIVNLARGLDENTVARLQDTVNVRLNTLDNGRIIPQSGVVALFLAPIVFIMIYLFATQISSGFLMSGVVEEKANRVMEILVTSVTPMQLLMGKILGLGALGLTQLAIWGVAGAIGLRFANASFLEGFFVPTDLLVYGLVYFILGYFLLSSILAGVGAVIGSEQESRQFAGIFSLVIVIPLFFIIQFFEEPNGTIPVLLTLIPFTAPTSALFRLGMGTIPPEQLVLSLGILVITTLIVVWAAARIFRWSILMYGKRPSLRDLGRALTARGMGTTATGERAG